MGRDGRVVPAMLTTTTLSAAGRRRIDAQASPPRQSQMPAAMSHLVDKSSRRPAYSLPSLSLPAGDFKGDVEELQSPFAFLLADSGVFAGCEEVVLAILHRTAPRHRRHSVSQRLVGGGTGQSFMRQEEQCESQRTRRYLRSSRDGGDESFSICLHK